MKLIETIELLSERIAPDTNRLSPSDSHTCLRNMWFKYRNVKPIVVNARKKAFAGACEDVALNWVKASGYNVIDINGHKIAKCPDDEFRLIKILSFSKSQFKAISRHGLPPNIEHCVMDDLHNSDKLSKRGNRLGSAQLIIICRDSLDLFGLEIEYNPEQYLLAASFIDDVQDSESMPAKCEGFYCSFCDYKDFCESNELASVNCRTCANVSIHDGEFHCPHGSSTCSNHIYHPQLMECAGYTVKGADPARMIIDYGDFVNGPEGQSLDGRPNFTSKELYRAAGKDDLLQDETLLNLLAVFDGRLIG